MKKILCGSAELFKTIKGFTPGDTDYIVITDSKEIFEHQHPEVSVCWFIWGGDKAMIRRYVTEFPYYYGALSLVTKEFVDHYEFTPEQVRFVLNKYHSIFENSIYRYYIPLFNYIQTYYSWEFPSDVIETAYKLYQTFKKRAD